MQKSFQRSPSTSLYADENSQRDIPASKPAQDSLEHYMNELRNDLSGSFRNSVYLQGKEALAKNAAPADTETPWQQLMLTEIHLQLLHAFARSAEAFGVDPALICYDIEVHPNPDGDFTGMLIMQPEETALLPTQNQIACEKLFEFVEELQGWVEENGDAEDGIFEVKPGTDQQYLVISYDYAVLYNALYAMMPELQGQYTASAKKIGLIEESLNSALHVMERYDTPVFRLN